MNAPILPALRRGTIVWHIGPRSLTPLRAIVVMIVPGGRVDIMASRFSVKVRRLLAEDVYRDKESCRAEILRRVAANTGRIDA